MACDVDEREEVADMQAAVNIYCTLSHDPTGIFMLGENSQDIFRTGSSAIRSMFIIDLAACNTPCTACPDYLVFSSIASLGWMDVAMQHEVAI